jgi:folate-binding protein YgfZ
MTSIDWLTLSGFTRYNLSHLGIMEITGEDAGQFLQGQLSCNINELNANKASIAAFCNPKGRVISTVLLIKTPIGFWLILPRSLLSKVLNKLKMYVLRSKVQLNDASNQLHLTGLSCHADNPVDFLPSAAFECHHIEHLTWIKLPSLSPLLLVINLVDQVLENTLELVPLGAEELWRFQEISSGFPWFDEAQSEQHIPQMLNIDQLGGISFNKGCYTGQEIVARTHYLGKIKRQLFLGECSNSQAGETVSIIKDAQTQEKLGDILRIQSSEQSCRLLMVLQTVDAETKNLILDDIAQTPVKLIPYQ